MSEFSTLGDLFAAGARSSADLYAWLKACDPALSDRLAAEAQLRGETLAQFVRIATADFMAEADEEAWASLISALRDGEDPGAVCVARVSAFRLQIERLERSP